MGGEARERKNSLNLASLQKHIFTSSQLCSDPEADPEKISHSDHSISQQKEQNVRVRAAFTMDELNMSEEISATVQQIKEGPKARLRELCKQYGLPVSGTRLYFQRVLCQKLGIDPRAVIAQKPTSRSNSHGDCCSVAGCRSRRGKDTHIRWFTVIRKKGSHTSAITKAIQLTRPGWTPTMYSRICGQHFSSGQLSFEPCSPDYIPCLHMNPRSKVSASRSFLGAEEEAMDLTNKGNLKASPAQIAGPSHQEQSVNANLSLHPAPEYLPLSVTFNSKREAQLPGAGLTPYVVAINADLTCLNSNMGIPNHYSLAGLGECAVVPVTAQQIKEGSKGELRELCKLHGLPLSGTRHYFQRLLCQKFGLNPKAVIPAKRTAADKMTGPSLLQHGTPCCVAGCPSRHGVHKHVQWFAAVRKSHAHTAALTRALRLAVPGWSPTFSSKICSRHFFSGRLSFVPGSPDYVPHLHMNLVETPTGHIGAETEGGGNPHCVNEDGMDPPGTDLHTLYPHLTLDTRNQISSAINHSLSERCPKTFITVTCYIPQGSVLGLLLFNIDMLLLIDVIHRHWVNFHIYMDVTHPQLQDHCVLTDCLSDIKSWMRANFSPVDRQDRGLLGLLGSRQRRHTSDADSITISDALYTFILMLHYH
eukprot:gi/632976124/ref/XP_007904621.1/ PREDICTED: uncharacterized protein LOC103187085 [Callorhinchus milii]